MTPGTHVAVLGDRPAIGVEGKLLGLEHRDTILVLRPGPVAGFVLLFRVPIAENTVAAQMMATGTGGLNIGGCRVASADEPVVHSGEQSPVTEAHDGYKRPGRSMYTHKPKERSGPADVGGRWPPNILLVHAPACQRVGTKKVGGAAPMGPSPGLRRGEGFGHQGKGKAHDYVDLNGLETVDAWECALGCPVTILDGLSGERPSTLTGRADPTRAHKNPGDNHGTSLFGGGNSRVYADNGGASRFYPQFESEGEMLLWLRRLLGEGVILRDSASLPRTRR